MNKTNIYIVGVNEKYNNLTKLFYDLKDDNSNKTIIIREGEYDIYREYIDSGIQIPSEDDSFDLTNEFASYCVFVPNNTHIVGQGNVILKFMPNKNEIGFKQSKVLSPINVAGSVIIENVEIHCKNGRFCVNDDFLEEPRNRNAIKKYINVRCYKYENDCFEGDYLGCDQTVGFGIDKGMKLEFINCYFRNNIDREYCAAFYMHDRNLSNNCCLINDTDPRVLIKNCAIESVGKTACLFRNSSNDLLKIDTEFNNCAINGYILSSNETDRAMESICNSYSYKFYNCGKIDLRILCKDNKYKPVFYDNYKREKLIALGDSITAGYPFFEKCKKWWEYVSETLNIDASPGCMSGSGFVHISNEENAVSIVNKYDFSDYDYAVIFFGTNDYGNNCTIGNENDNYITEKTVYGAINYIVNKIYKDNPNILIMFSLPLIRKTGLFGENNERIILGDINNHFAYNYKNNIGYTLNDYSNAIINRCKFYGIPIISHENGYFNSITINSLLCDGLHPSIEGYIKLGKEMAAKISSIVK